MSEWSNAVSATEASFAGRKKKENGERESLIQSGEFEFEWGVLRPVSI